MVLLTLDIQLSAINQEYVIIQDKYGNNIYEGYYQSRDEYGILQLELKDYLEYQVDNVEPYVGIKNNKIGLLIEISEVN